MIKIFKKGMRVQAYEGTDQWMTGDKYGEVTKDVFTLAHVNAVLPERRLVPVKMAKSGRTIKFHPCNLKVLGA